MNNKVICNKAGSHGGCDGCFHYDEHKKKLENSLKYCTIWAECQNWDTGELIKQRCVHVVWNLKCFDK